MVPDLDKETWWSDATRLGPWYVKNQLWELGEHSLLLLTTKFGSCKNKKGGYLLTGFFALLLNIRISFPFLDQVLHATRHKVPPWYEFDESWEIRYPICSCRLLAPRSCKDAKFLDNSDSCLISESVPSVGLWMLSAPRYPSYKFMFSLFRFSFCCLQQYTILAHAFRLSCDYKLKKIFLETPSWAMTCLFFGDSTFSMKWLIFCFNWGGRGCWDN